VKLGAEPKKVVMLGGLVLVGGYLFYTNVLSQSPNGPPSSAPIATPTAARTAPSGAKSPVPGGVRRPGRARNSEDFRPTLKLPQGEDRADPSTIDPTLKLELLAKVQAVEMQGGQRNLFQFSTPPPPPAPLKGPEPKVTPKPAAELVKEQEARKAEAPKPVIVPINLKYYGYSSIRGDGSRKAFFLDGEDILVATEGEVVKKRYRVVRIGVSSVVMEDTQSKTQQTLPLQEEVAG
jgi:hypothetical protein